MALYNLEKPKTILTNANSQDAVNLWFSYEANATATYGYIRGWNTSAVTTMRDTFNGAAVFKQPKAKKDLR